MNSGLRIPEWQGISYTETYNEVDCKEKGFKIIQGTTYYKDGHKEPHDGSDREYLRPRTAIETMFKFICDDLINIPESSPKASVRTE